MLTKTLLPKKFKPPIYCFRWFLSEPVICVLFPSFGGWWNRLYVLYLFLSFGGCYLVEAIQCSAHQEERTESSGWWRSMVCGETGETGYVHISNRHLLLASALLSPSSSSSPSSPLSLSYNLSNRHFSIIVISWLFMVFNTETTYLELSKKPFTWRD